MTDSKVKDFKAIAKDYLNLLYQVIDEETIESCYDLAIEISMAWKKGQRVYICGNGGSATNAMHIANDLHYGVGKCNGRKWKTGVRIEALPSNVGIITCLANDEGYEHIYSNQIEVKGEKGDLLIVLSGSGNSMNVVNAIKKANDKGLRTYGILAYDGGKCLKIAKKTIHVKANDMQIAEDSQLIIGHLCMKWLNEMD